MLLHGFTFAAIQSGSNKKVDGPRFGVKSPGRRVWRSFQDHVLLLFCFPSCCICLSLFSTLVSFYIMYAPDPPAYSDPPIRLSVKCAKSFSEVVSISQKAFSNWEFEFSEVKWKVTGVKAKLSSSVYENKVRWQSIKLEKVEIIES